MSEEKLRAASFFEELGHHDKAAEAYLKAGSSLDAAAQFVKAGHHDRAARGSTRNRSCAFYLFIRAHRT